MLLGGQSNMTTLIWCLAGAGTGAILTLGYWAIYFAIKNRKNKNKNKDE